MKMIGLSSLSRKGIEVFKNGEVFELTHQAEVIGVVMTIEEFKRISNQEESKTSSNEPKKESRTYRDANGILQVRPVPRDPNKEPSKGIEIDWTKVPEIDGPNGWPMPNPEYIPPEQRIEE